MRSWWQQMCILMIMRHSLSGCKNVKNRPSSPLEYNGWKALLKAFNTFVHSHAHSLHSCHTQNKHWLEYCGPSSPSSSSSVSPSDLVRWHFTKDKQDIRLVSPLFYWTPTQNSQVFSAFHPRAHHPCLLLMHHRHYSTTHDSSNNSNRQNLCIAENNCTIK